MKRWTGLLVAFAWLLTAGQGLAQEKYTIKLKELSKGDSRQVEHKEAMIVKSSAVSDKDKDPKTFEMKNGKHFIFMDKFQEWPAGAPLPTKLTRTYQKADVETPSLPIPLPEKKEPGPSLAGKTIVIEKKGDKYEFRLDDGSALPPGPVGLDDEFNKQEYVRQKKALMPPGPVAVNETWKVNPKEFIGDMAKDDKGPQITSAEGVAKLVKVYKKDGRLYGVIDADMKLDMKQSLGDPKAADTLTMLMKGTVKFTLDACIDGSFAESRMNGKVNMGGSQTMTIPGAGTITSQSDVVVTIEETSKELSKK